MFAAFAGAGALQGLGEGMLHERNLQEAIDTNYKMQQTKLDANKQLIDAKVDDAENLARAKQQDSLSTVQKEYQAQQQPPVPQAVNPAGNAGASPMPGVPSTMGGQQPQGPIKPTMQPIQQQQPQTQVPVPQSGLSAGNPIQGGLNSPQGGPVPIQGNAPPPPDKEDVPPTAPAAQVAGQSDAEHAMQTQDPYDIMANKLATGNGSFGQNTHDMYMNAHALYPNLSPEQIAAGVDNHRKGEWDTKEFSKNMTQLNATAVKEAKNTVDMSQWGSEDKASIGAMQREGVIGSTEQIKPLNAGQVKDNDQLVQQAYNMKNAATQGIGTFSRIIQDTSKINPGPGADTAAYVKSAWAQMTGSQRSEALTTFFEGQKETVNALNAQINTMRQQGGRFVVGANVLKLEERGIPDITKMSPEASLSLAQGYINNYKQMIGQADAVIGTPEQISPVKRIQFANKYAESNPTFTGDGQTPNANWQEFKEWRDNGVKEGSVSGASNRAQATQDAAGALSNAKQGGTGTVPTPDKDPNIAAIQSLPQFKGATVTKINK